MIVRAGQVYISNSGEDVMRRIVATLGDYVYYSSGGDANHACKRATFIRWVRERNVCILLPGIL